MTEVRTSYLGQFEDANAESIAGRLEEAGIVWWHKQPGRWSKVFFADSWGVRIFVQEDRLDEARTIAEEIAPGAL